MAMVLSKWRSLFGRGPSAASATAPTLGDELRAQIAAAEAEIDRGEYVEYDADTIHSLAKDVHARGLERLAAQRDMTGARG